jgi:hypothetical protein
MRTTNLLGTVAIVALLGGTAVAQDAGGYMFATDDAGEQMMNDVGEPIVLRPDGTEATSDEYEINEAGEIVVLVVEEEVEGQAAIGAEGLNGGELVVEQPDPTINVDVPDPVVTVDQAQPQVTVEQPTPEITVQQSPPTVNVEQQAPIITVEQQDPVVTVVIPEPIVTIQMPAPDVQVAQGEAEVAVEMPEPVVEFIRPEPQIRIEQAEPQVNIAEAEPQINIERTQAADVQIEQAEAEVQVEEVGEAQVNVTEAEPQVQIEEAEGADVEIEQAEAEIDVQQEEANVEVVDPAAIVEPDAEALAVLETEGYIVTDGVEETEEARTARLGAYEPYAEMTAADLVGVDVEAADGETIGEIDSLVLMSDRLMAIVGVGGFLGLGERNVAIPLERLQMEGDRALLGGLDSDQIQNFPEYDEAAGELVPTDGRIGDLY